MSLEKVVHSLMELLPEIKFSEDDTVLVCDTNFLVAVSQKSIWSYSVLTRMKRIAEEKGKGWTAVIPRQVTDEYDRLWEHGVIDEELGILIARKSSSDLFKSSESAIIHLDDGLYRAAEHMWKHSPTRQRQAAHTGQSVSQMRRFERTTPGKADLGVTAYALGIAVQGADVYIASSDNKDLIKPLQDFAVEIEQHGLKITVLPPSPLQYEYLRSGDIVLEAVVTNNVISELQQVKKSGIGYPVLIFEKGVKSGDVTFDAGVGVAFKQYFREFKLPSEFTSISENHSVMPVLHARSLRTEADGVKLTRDAREHPRSYQLVVIDGSTPYYPYLLQPHNSNNTISEVFVAPLDFLYYQTDSLFARKAYVPPRHRLASSQTLS